MSANIAKEVAALGRLTVKDLRTKHVEVFGEATRSGNKDWLRKRIAWRIQANASGDLSERARRRAEELANDADLRTTAPKVKADQVHHHHGVGRLWSRCTAAHARGDPAAAIQGPRDRGSCSAARL